MRHGAHARGRLASVRSRRTVLVALMLSVAPMAGVVIDAERAAGAAPKWSITPSPSYRGEEANALNGVSCVTANDCFAVGYHGTPTATKVLIEHWNGNKWLTMASPNKPSSLNYLFGVSCANANRCIAVGYFHDADRRYKPLVEGWNGNKWSIMTVPNPTGSTFTALNGVSCPGANSCFAVGYTLGLGNTGRQDARGTLERKNVVDHDRAQPGPLGVHRPERGVVSDPDELLRRRRLLGYRRATPAGGVLERQHLEDPGQPEPGRRGGHGFRRRVVLEPQALLRGRPSIGGREPAAAHRALERQQVGDREQPETERRDDRIPAHEDPERRHVFERDQLLRGRRLLGPTASLGRSSSTGTGTSGRSRPARIRHPRRTPTSPASRVRVQRNASRSVRRWGRSSSATHSCGFLPSRRTVVFALMLTDRADRRRRHRCRTRGRRRRRDYGGPTTRVRWPTRWARCLV